MDANAEETFKIIGLYEQFPCLWDYRSSSYKNTSSKNNAWLEIAKAMGKSTEYSKKKIKHLRSVYVAEKKKVDASKKSGTSADSIYQPHLYYYENINFLASVVVLRKTTSNLKSEDDVDNLIEFGSENATESQDSSIFLSETSTQDTYKSSSFEMCSTPVASKSLKKMKLERDEQFKNALDAIVKKASDNKAESETMFSAFGKTIALQLKELPIIAATNAMAEMQKYIANIMNTYSKQNVLVAAMTDADINEFNC